MNWRETFKDRKVIYGAGSIVSVLLVAGILVVVALLANWQQVRWDVTQGKTQSISGITKVLLKQVDKPLTMTAFLPEGSGEKKTVRDLLQRYAYNNPKISFSFVDPEREPLKAKEAGYRYPGNVLLTYNGRHQMSDKADENSITNALRRLLKPGSKKIYFLTGHGERELSGNAQNGMQTANRALENEGYKVAPLNLLTQPQVPKDAAVVVVASPKNPLLETEINSLKAYMDRGGRVLVMLEAFQDSGLQGFLAGYGVTLDDGIILDVNQVSQSLRISPVMPLAFQYGPSRITQDLKNTLTMYPMSRPLTLNRGVKGVFLAPLVSTMPSSYEKLGKEWVKTGKGNFDPKTDKKGPFTIGVLAEIQPAPAKPPPQPAAAAPKPGGQNPAVPVEKSTIKQPVTSAKKAADPKPAASAKTAPAEPKPAEKTPAAAKEPAAPEKAYLAVYGDVDFADNAYFNLFGNGDLFLNTINYLAGEQQQIMVRSAQKAQILVLSGNQIWILFVVSLVWAPLLLVVAGVWAYRTRRARK